MRALDASNIQNRVGIAQRELSGVMVPALLVSGSRVAENLATVSALQRHYELAALGARDPAGTVPDARM
jgi:hypothetical protein